MKSKTLNTLVFVLFFLFSTSPIFAEGDKNHGEVGQGNVNRNQNPQILPAISEPGRIETPAIEETQKPRQQTQNQTQLNTNSATQERRNVLTQLKLQVAHKIQTRIQNQLQYRFEQLEKTQLRLEEKLALRKEQGQDVSLVESQLEGLVSIKSSYQANFNNFINASNQMMASDKPAQFSSQLRQASRLVNGNLNSYRQSLKRAIQTLINLPKVD